MDPGKKKGFALLLPFDNYVKTKDEWMKKNPDVGIIEEIKTLSLGMIDVPDPMRIGHTKQQQVLMIFWAVVYYELEFGWTPVEGLPSLGKRYSPDPRPNVFQRIKFFFNEVLLNLSNNQNHL